MCPQKSLRQKPGFIAFWIIVLVCFIVFPIIAFINLYHEMTPELHQFFIIYLIVFSLVWIGMFFFIPWAEGFFVKLARFLKEHKTPTYVVLVLLYILSIIGIIYLSPPYTELCLILNLQLFLMIMVLLPFPFESILLIPGTIFILTYLMDLTLFLLDMTLMVVLIIVIVLILVLTAGAKSVSRTSPFRDPERGAVVLTIIVTFTTAIVCSFLFFRLLPIYYFLIFSISHIIIDLTFAIFNLHRNWDVIQQKIIDFYHAHETIFNSIFFALFIIFIVLLFTAIEPFNIISGVIAIIFAIILPITLPFPLDVIFLVGILIFMFIAFPLIALRSLMWLWIQIPIIIKWVSGVKARNRKRRQKS